MQSKQVNQLSSTFSSVGLKPHLLPSLIEVSYVSHVHVSAYSGRDFRISRLTYLAVFAVLDIFLPVEEPVWDFVLARVLHDSHHTLHLEGTNTALN